jgi:hypothetical protein
MGWLAEGNQAIAAADPRHPASNGSAAVAFNLHDRTGTDSALTQTFQTEPGRRYELAFDAGTVGAIADQQFRIVVRGEATLLDTRVVVAGISAEPYYVPQRLTFVADDTATTVTFHDKSVTYVGIDALLDNVRVTTVEPASPVITASPVRLAVAEGKDATFRVAATGSAPLRYQWQFNGEPIAGATGSSYTVSRARRLDAGNYRVLVMNDAATATSSSATLTVLPPAVLLNGSFEYGSAAWLFEGTYVSTSTNPAYGVTDGTQLAHFNWGQQQPNGTIAQTIQTTPGMEYTVAFDVGAFSLMNHNEQSMQITAQGKSRLLTQSVVVSANGKGGTYTRHSFTFRADDTATTIAFHDTSMTTMNVDLLLDNVMVTPKQPMIDGSPRRRQ